MRRGILIALSLILLVSPATRGYASDEPPKPLGLATRLDLPHAEDHVLVKLKPGVAAEALGPSTHPVFDRWRIVPIPGGRAPLEFVSALGGRPEVAVAELDYRVQLEPRASASPGDVGVMAVNDPLTDFQWHFPAVQLEAAWTQTSGAGVVVAVVDTGISPDGEDLACHAFVEPYNAITETAGMAAADDDHGHGTHVAGTVAQCTDNGVGVAGVAYDAELMPVKVLDSSGFGDMSSIARGVDWARIHQADVINLSLGCVGCSSSILSDAIQAATGAGIVVVAAAGNQGINAVSFPANLPDVIAVGAVDYNLGRSPYSNGGADLDMVAPGGDLNQDANGDGNPDGVLQETFELTGTTKNFGYYFFQGTSMAAPHVAGAVALLLSVRPEASPEIIKGVLTSSAKDLGTPGPDTSYGYGMLQIKDALDTLATIDTSAPVWAEDARLHVSRYGEDELVLSWEGASDNVGVAAYRLRLDGTTGFDVTGTSTQVTGLSPGSTYPFEVLARDEAGNWSQPLSAVVRTSRHFVDVGGNIFHQDILWLSGEDITRGCNPPLNDEFCPENALTRQEMSAFLTRALGLTANTHQGFIDVPPGNTFAVDIGRIATAGITKGCNPPDNDRFCPDDPVTRGQLAAFLHRALSLASS